MRTSIAYSTAHDFKQPISFPRRDFCAQALHLCFANPIEGWRSAERRSGARRSTRAAYRQASKTRANALATRAGPRRLARRLASLTRDARLSALHRGAAGRHASLRIQDRLENTPFMSKAAN